MPLRREHVQFLLLFLSVPLQYMTVHHLGFSEDHRSYAVSQMIDRITAFRFKWLRLEPWRKWGLNFFEILDRRPVSEGESPAVEVLKYREKLKHFAQSTVPRDFRPSTVKFRVGQVVRVLGSSQRGVVTGWDLELKAPEEWLKKVHGAAADRVKSQPNYSVLLDSFVTADGSGIISYVPQESLEPMTNTKISSDSLDDYFEGFDGSQYLMRPWLRTVYPRD